MSDVKTLVIYHAQCADGFTSAWLAKTCLPPDTEFHAAAYGTWPPDVEGKRVFILDFSYKKPVMEDIIKKAYSVVCLDHHKTAEAELSAIVAPPPKWHLVFDNSKSGARLTWEYFSKVEYFKHHDVPRMVEYTEARDLWLWNLPYSREINAAIKSYSMTFETWDKLEEALCRDPDNLRGVWEGI